MRIRMMKISFLRHDCGASNIIQAVMGQKTTKCKFYWKMKGGDSYHGNIHFFTLLGFRMTIWTIKKKDLWIV